MLFFYANEGAEKEMKANNNRKLIDETLQLAGDNQQLQRNILELYKTILDLKSEIIKLKDKRLVKIESHYLDEAIRKWKQCYYKGKSKRSD